MSSSKKSPQIIAGLAAAGGAFCTGTTLGWSSPAASRLLDDEQYFPITKSQWTWITSIIAVGCAISCIPIGYLMNKIGRKWTMLGLVIPFLLGWTLIIWAVNFIMMFMGRLFLGLAGGAFCISAPQYSSEIAEKEIRGTIGIFFQLLISLGILFSYVIGAYLSVYWTSILCGICPIIFGIIFVFMPESPVYLVIKNKEDEAKHSLMWLRGKNYNPDSEISELKKHLFEEINDKVPFSETIREKASISSLVIGIGLLYFQQMGMINAILFYSTTIFAAAGVGLSPDISTILVGAIMVISSLFGALLVDFLGRKILLIISIAVMSLSLFILGGFFYIQSVDDEYAETLGWLPLTSLLVYIIFYPIGYGGIPWVVTSEVAPKKMKAFCGPIVGCFAWTMGFLVPLSYPNISATFGTAATLWIFGVACIFGFLFTIFVVPETKGKTLAEIEDALNNSKNK